MISVVGCGSRYEYFVSWVSSSCDRTRRWHFHVIVNIDCTVWTRWW